MKRLLQTIMLGLMLSVFALPSLAQDPAASPSQTEQDAQSEVYKKFTEAYNRGKAILKDDPNLAKQGNKEAFAQANKEANQYASEYLQRWPNVTGDIPNYLKKFVTNYAKSEKEARKGQLTQLFKDKKYDEGFALAKQILADEPDDLGTLYNLVIYDFFAVTQDGKKSFNADTPATARKAIRLIESGKTFVPGQPIAQKDKDDYLGRLNYALGLASIENAPADAVGAFIKVASIEGAAKKDAQTYFLLAAAYESSEYKKLATDFSTQCKTPEQLATPACTAMKDRLNLVVNRIVDAYARAVSFSSANPAYATKKTEWMKSLSDYYKYLHEGKDEGLTEYIAGITNQPLPGPLPPAGATPAPSSGGDNSTGTTMTPDTTTAPSSTTTTTPSTAAPKATMSPAATTASPTATPQTTPE